MSDVNLKIEENTSDESVGRVFTLGIEESIATSDQDDGPKKRQSERSKTITADVDRTFGLAVTFTASRGPEPFYWTSDRTWSKDWSWVKPLRADQERIITDERVFFNVCLENIVSQETKESFSLKEDYKTKHIRNFYEFFTLQDKMISACLMWREYEEAVAFDVLYENKFTKHSFEQFGISDDWIKIITKNSPVDIIVNDKIRTRCLMWRWYTDDFSIDDDVSKTVTLYKNESLKIFDGMRRAAQGVISDVIFESGSWDYDSIKKASRNGRHAGFGNWETFIVGNHSYSSALFRTTIETSSVELGLLTNFYILIDVKDVQDRGAIYLKNTGGDTFVRFNKVFLIEPEVVATIRTGTSASTMVPVVGKITREGFYVSLKNMSDDTEIAGTISWIAHGY